MPDQNNLAKKIQALPKPQRFALVVSILIFFVLFILAIDHSSYLRGHWQETFVVVQNDAARSCQRRRSGFTFKTRSETPQRALGHYCGIIATDRGIYLLPENANDYLFYDNRHEMDDKLRPGCKITATIVGADEPYSPKRKPRVPIRQFIANIHNVEDC
jgi:hypothetical protein